MKKLLTFIAITAVSILFWFAIKPQTNNVDLKVLESDLQKISNMEDTQIAHGDLVFHTTEGALVLQNILNNRSNFKSKQEKIDLCISIVGNRNLYHLHDIAGSELAKLLKRTKTVNYLQARVPEDQLGYFLLRVNHTVSSVIGAGDFFELDPTKQLKLIRLLENSSLSHQTKLYLIDALYSYSFKAQTGKALHDAISNLEISSSLTDYNEFLFDIFRQLKPRYETLENISTWKEMDGMSEEIKVMMANYHPIIFLQILCFNPSTVLESHELCLLKETALHSIIADAQVGTFYDDYKLIYANELLCSGNYVTRFLDQLIARDEIQNYRLELTRDLMERPNQILDPTWTTPVD